METRVTFDPARFNPLQVEACRVALHRRPYTEIRLGLILLRQPRRHVA